MDLHDVRDLRDLRDLRGTPAFAGALAERERTLGLLLTRPAAVATIAAPMPETVVPAVGSVDTIAYDRFGNRILGAPGRYGQRRIQSARDWDSGRIVRVCGEAETTNHLLWWQYDGGERRCVCRLCWPGEAPRVPREAPADAQGQREGAPTHV